MDIVTTLAAASLPIGLEGIGQQVEMVGLRAEVGQVLALFGELGDSLFHRGTIIAVIAVTLDNQGLDLFAEEDVFKGILNGGGPGTGRTGNRNHRMLY